MFDASGARLLLVIAEPVLARLTSFRLELLGYQVEKTTGGSEASAAIAKMMPDLIITDTSLCDGDGIEWISRVRIDHAAEQLPIAIFSLDPSLETVERAFHAGAQDYLISPFDPIVMEEKIESLLFRYRRPKRSGRSIDSKTRKAG